MRASFAWRGIWVQGGMDHVSHTNQSVDTAESG